MSDIMRRERVGSYAQWEAPRVGRDDGGHGTLPAELAAIRKSAHDEGYARGHTEGLAAAAKAIDELTTQLKSIATALQQPLDAVDEQVIDKIVTLAISIAKRLVRRELRTNRAEVVGVVREALAILPVGLKDIRLHLHPEDARLVGETLVPVQGEAAWRIVEDPVITRGGCRISSSTSQVDATVETRLSRVINTILGGERDNDRG